MDFDLRASKLQKEAEQRKNEARKKRERELKLAEEQQRREQAHAQQLLERRIQLELEEQQRRLLQEEELIRTGGINCVLENLVVFPLEDSGDDRIVLPESVLAQICSPDGTDAFGNGPVIFEVSVARPKECESICTLDWIVCTHCGVREFTAADNTVKLPSKVVASIYSNLQRIMKFPATVQECCSLFALPSLKISFKYVKLPKVRKCTFRTEKVSLDVDKVFVGNDALVDAIPSENKCDIMSLGPIKRCLEENLSHHVTLTVGDRLTVWYRGKAFDISVMSLEPDICGSLVDTDVEILFDDTELTPNVSVPVQGVPVPTPPVLRDVTPPIAPIAHDVDLSSIGEEPPADGNNVFSCRIRMPDGSSVSRRFLFSAPALHLLEFVGAKLGAPLQTISITCRSLQVPLTYQALDDMRIVEKEVSINDIAIEKLGFTKRELINVSIL